MKTSFFTFLIFFMFISCAYAQQHREFAPIGAEWYYSAADYDKYHPHREYIKFWVNRDTVVGEKTCRIIENDSKRISASDDPDLVKTIIPPYIVYEEDGKVYKWSKDRFYLMYDFNAQLGDTLNLYLQVVDTSFNYALSDSMFLYPCVVADGWFSGLNGDTVWNISMSPLDYTVGPSYLDFIEYIGNERDYIFTNITNTQEYLSPVPPKLRCYRDSTYSHITMYWGMWMYECNYRYDLGMNALKYPGLQVDIYPNPAQDYLTIQFQENGFYLPNTWIYIDNAEGKTCLKQQITLPQTQINISALPAGIYFIKIQSTDKVCKTTKIIKL